jgi:hypothetical protein
MSMMTSAATVATWYSESKTSAKDEETDQFSTHLYSRKDPNYNGKYQL